MCYEKNCRLCMKDLLGSRIDCTKHHSLNSTIASFFEVEILWTDTCKFICSECFKRILNFDAYKRKVKECQQILQDHEAIKKKIFESYKSVSIKEEIIDLTDYSATYKSLEQIQNNNKFKSCLSINQSVTDSDINHVLDILHDNSTLLKTINNRESSVQSLVKRSDIFFIPSESKSSEISKSIYKSEGTDFNAVKSDSTVNTHSNTMIMNGESIDYSNASGDLTPSTVNCVSNSFQFSADAAKHLKDSCLQENHEGSNIRSTLYSLTRKKRKMSKENSSKRKKQLLNKTNMTNFNDLNAQGNNKIKSDVVLSSVRLNSSRNISDVKMCEGIDLKEDHIASKLMKKRKRTSRKEEIRKFGSNVSERSTGQTESQALKKISNSNLLEMNKTVAEGESHLNITGKTVGLPANKIGQEIPESETVTKSLNEKRTITLTVIRTKHNLNLRYSDESKQLIDFEDISDEELKDIKSVLTQQKVLDDLMDIFKKTPPDNKVINQLNVIFKNNF